MGRGGEKQTTQKGGGAAERATWSGHPCLLELGLCRHCLLFHVALSCPAAGSLSFVSACLLSRPCPCGKHSPSLLLQSLLWEALCVPGHRANRGCPHCHLLWLPLLTQGTRGLVWPQPVVFRAPCTRDLHTSSVSSPHLCQRAPCLQEFLTSTAFRLLAALKQE